MSQFPLGHTPGRIRRRGATATLPALLLAACAAAPPASVVESPRQAVVEVQELVVSGPPLEPAASISALPSIVDANAIYFRRGESQVDVAEAAKLGAHVERLRSDPRLVVTLVGHTDHLGSRAYNLAIAEQRTAAVMKHLRELGVPAKQIRRRSYGNETAGNCRSETCRIKMRRVDLIYPKQRK